MSLILDLSGNDPIHKTCESLFGLYCQERGIKTHPERTYIMILKNYYKEGFLKIFPQKPDPVPETGITIYKRVNTFILASEKEKHADFLFNAALFCTRSLLSEIRPQHVDRYGSIPTDSENCDTGLTIKRLENLFQVTEKAITIGLIPKDSTPETYIRMLMKLYDDILNVISPDRININFQLFCVLYFYSHKIPVDTSTGIKVEAVNNYEFYSNNVVPFYLNPEKDPFLSPYNYDAYYDDKDENVNENYRDKDYYFGEDYLRYRRILANFSYMKRMRMIFGYVCKSKGKKHVSTPYVDNGMTLNEDYTKVPLIELDGGHGVDLVGICKNCREAAKGGDIWNSILPNHYLSFYHRNDYYNILADRQKWKDLGVDIPSPETNYSIDGITNPHDVILNLWQSGLYRILDAVIKGSNMDLLGGSVLLEVYFNEIEELTLLHKIYGDTWNAIVAEIKLQKNNPTHGVI